MEMTETIFSQNLLELEKELISLMLKVQKEMIIT
jgi:hypothetical protein